MRFHLRYRPPREDVTPPAIPAMPTPRRRRWLRQSLAAGSVALLLAGSLAAWGAAHGWDRYVHYRSLPDWQRAHEHQLLRELAATATAREQAGIALAGASPAASLAPATPVVDYMRLADGTVTDDRIDSPILGQALAWRVYLPPGYDDPRLAGRRYPVVYLLHGAPGSDPDWTDGGAADQTADALIKSRTIRPLIIVMPDGSLGDAHHDTQWGNSPVTGERVEDALIQDLIPAIDARYRTIPSREGRAIGGLSSGGYGATNIALHHPETFSVALSLSGYFEAAQTIDGHDIWGSETARQANSPLETVHPLPQPFHLLLVEGLDEGPGVDQTHAFDAALGQAGIDHETRFFPGGHSWSFWKDHLLEALQYADRYLGTATAGDRPAPGHAPRT